MQLNENWDLIIDVVWISEASGTFGIIRFTTRECTTLEVGREYDTGTRTSGAGNMAPSSDKPSNWGNMTKEQRKYWLKHKTEVDEE